MARTLLRGIAVALGTGLAAGTGLAFGSSLSRARTKGRYRQPVATDLQPLIERLDRMETRVTLAEARPSPAIPRAVPDDAAFGASLKSIEGRLDAQAREIELLNIRAVEAERLADAEIRLTERRFGEVAAELPAVIEAVVDPRIEDLRWRLHGHIKESVAAALTNFEQSFDTRITSGIAAVERTVTEQSLSLAELSQRVGQADANLQKLVAAVELLCQPRTVLRVPPAPERPFEKHLRPVISETSVASGRGTSSFRSRLVGDVSREENRPRVPLAHILIATMAFLGARFLG